MTSGNSLEKSIVGLGNPLLDICATVDQEFLDKYKIKLDNAILAEDLHLPMYDELSKGNAEFVAGGATQNSIRVAQWMLKNVCSNATTFFGCVGDDEFGKKLNECAKMDGVDARYLIDEKAATGTCAVCVKDGERSLVANLSAANNYKENHLEKDEHFEEIKKGRIFYSSGFHLTVCPPAMVKIAEHAKEEDKIFMVNLAAPFISEFFKDPLMQILEYGDYVFGNETEAVAFGKAKGWGEDLKAIALNLAKMPKKSGTRPRTVVFTQGADSTIVASNGTVVEYSVPELKSEEIVDTNGAGDAFVGGFIAQLAQEKTIEECVDAGHWAAQVVIRQSGCTFPAECNYTR